MKTAVTHGPRNSQRHIVLNQPSGQQQKASSVAASTSLDPLKWSVYSKCRSNVRPAHYPTNTCENENVAQFSTHSYVGTRTFIPPPQNRPSMRSYFGKCELYALRQSSMQIVYIDEYWKWDTLLKPSVIVWIGVLYPSLMMHGFRYIWK